MNLEDNDWGWNIVNWECIDDINISEFLRADNNGIRLTNDYFIFSVGDKNLILKRS